MTKYVQRARRGEGPALLECMTFRHYGHNFGDTAWYRPESYMEEANQKDAIERFKVYLLQNGCTQKQIEWVEVEVEKTLNEAITFAEEAPYPSPETAWDRVYSMDNVRCISR